MVFIKTIKYWCEYLGSTSRVYACDWWWSFLETRQRTVMMKGKFGINDSNLNGRSTCGNMVFSIQSCYHKNCYIVPDCLFCKQYISISFVSADSKLWIPCCNSFHDMSKASSFAAMCLNQPEKQIWSYLLFPCISQFVVTVLSKLCVEILVIPKMISLSIFTRQENVHRNPFKYSKHMYVVYEGGKNSSKTIITMYHWSGLRY